MKFAAIITARNKSKRLPGKHLLKVNNMTFIEILINRLKFKKSNFDIILAVSKNKSDNIFERIAKKNNIICFRGSSNNVKQRVIKAALDNRIEHIIKIWGDSPLIDSRVIVKAIKFYKKIQPVVLATNVKRYLPDGMDFHIYPTSFLLKSLKYSKSLKDQEHVDYIFMKNKKKFKVLSYNPGKRFHFPRARLLLDYVSDYFFFQKFFENKEVKKRGFLISCENIIRILKKNKELVKINSI